MASQEENTLQYLIYCARWDDAMVRMGTEEGGEELRRKVALYGGELPLHLACSGGAPLELVEAIVKKYPEAVRVTNRRGVLPLHVACSHVRYGDSSPQVVRLLLNAYPEGAAKGTDWNGRLPLHIVAHNRTPSEVLRMVVDAYPEGVTSRDRYDRLPVHLLAECASPDQKEDVEKVELLLRPLIFDEEACRARPGFHGALPLHIATKFDLSVEIIRSLLDTYGDAAKETCRRDGESVYALDLLEDLRNEVGTGEEIERFNEKSDLIFAYNPSIELHRTSERMRRFERRVQIESKSEEGLSVEMQKTLAWMFTTSIARPPDKRGSENDTDGNLADGKSPRRQSIVDVEPCGIGVDDTPSFSPAAVRLFERGNDGKLADGDDVPRRQSIVDVVPGSFEVMDDKPFVPFVPARSLNLSDLGSLDLPGSDASITEFPLSLRSYTSAVSDIVCAATSGDNDWMSEIIPNEREDGADDASSGSWDTRKKATALVDLIEQQREKDVLDRLKTSDGKEEAKGVSGQIVLPLHEACLRGASLTIVNALLAIYSEAAMVTDDVGRLPLHCACEPLSGTPSPEVVQRLLDVYPEGSKRADSNGCLPLHCAARIAAPADIMQMLLDVYGDAAKLKCNIESRGTLYALDMLENLRADRKIANFNETSDLLFSYYPNIPGHRVDKSRLDRFIQRIAEEARDRKLSGPAQRVWVWLCTFRNADNSADNYVPQIHAILSRLGGRRNVEWLASIETPGVRQVQEIAVPECAKAIHSHLLFAGRLELSRDPPLHKSATCIVVDARDFGGPYESIESRQAVSELNDFKRVVVKFMSNADQFKREIESRSLDDSKRCSERMEQPFLAPCITYFDSSLTSAPDAHYKRDIQESADVFGHDLLCYPYAVVMHRADKNFDSIYRHEVPSMLKIRGYMEEVANLLKELHNTGKIHADVKLLNIVRLNSMLTLVDMDSHREIGVDHSGIKISTGILPPEMLYELKTQEEEKLVLSYWKDVWQDFQTIEKIKVETKAEVPDAISDVLAKGRGVENASCESRLRLYAEQSVTVHRLLKTHSFSIDVFYKVWARLRKNEALWKKIRPRVSKAGRKFVPRAFRQGCNCVLPYDLVHAKATIDIWSFGVLLYKVCAKSDLFEVDDGSSDLLHGEAYCELACWDTKASSCKEKFDRVENKEARDLLTWLLSKDAAERPKEMKDVLNHDFFKADYTEAKGKLEREIAKLTAKLNEMSTDARKEMVEKANEVKELKRSLKKKKKELSMWTVSLSTLVDCRNWEALARRVKNAPDAMPKCFLHSVCKRGPTLAVVDAVILANEDIVKEGNGLDGLPIHVACCYGTELRVIQRFVRLHPASISKVTALDQTPLDIAQTAEWTYWRSDQIDVVKYLRRQCHEDYFDDITGLPGRAAMEKWAPLPPPGVQKSDAKVFVLNIDISGFKSVNDNTRDHKIGDDAIKHYARNITDACEKYVASAKKRSMHLVIDVFRPGGDEFVVAAKCAKSCIVEAVRTKIVKPLAKSLGDLTFDDREEPCRYCTFLRIGCCTGNLDRIDDVLGKADKLQFEIKQEIGLERGDFISLRELRGKGISNLRMLN